MSDLENHEEITKQIENFSTDEVELTLGSTFNSTKDLSIDLSYRRLVFDNEDDYNNIDFSKPTEMELGQCEESFKIPFGGYMDDEIHILTGMRYENNKEDVDEDSEKQCLLIYDDNSHTWTLECVDYNYNVGTDGDILDYEREFEISMQDEEQEFEVKDEDIDEFIEEYNENGITNGIHEENGYEGGNSEDELMEDDAFVEVENPFQPPAHGVNNVIGEEIIKNDVTESSGTSSSGSSSSSVSGSESGDESDSTGSELGSDLGNFEAAFEAQIDIAKTNGVNRKTNPSTGRPEGPISLTELFGGTGNEQEQDDDSGSSSASE